MWKNRWLKWFMAVLLAVVLVSPWRVEAADPRDSSDFVMVSDEIPDVLQEIRYYSAYNFVGSHIDGYEDRMVAGQTYKFPRVAAGTVYLWPPRVQPARYSSWPWAWRW